MKKIMLTALLAGAATVISTSTAYAMSSSSTLVTFDQEGIFKDTFARAREFRARQREQELEKNPVEYKKKARATKALVEVKSPIEGQHKESWYRSEYHIAKKMAARGGTLELPTQNSLVTKIVGKLGQSRFAKALSARWGQEANEQNLTAAPDDLQIVWDGIQAKAGIQEEDRVPLYISSRSDLPDVGGFAYPNKVVLHAHYDQDMVRAILSHEAIHIKYNDTAMRWAVPKAATTTLAASALIALAYSFLSNSTGRTFTVASAGGLGGLCHLSPLFISLHTICFQERRADIEGFLNTECHKCLEPLLIRSSEISEDKSSWEEFYSYGGYLNSYEVSQIYQKFKNNDSLCPYHAKN